MSSETYICNLALSNIRSAGINSLDEGSAQAQQCKLKYPLMRDMMLNDYSWNFAHKIKPLTPVDHEIFNWAYAYQYPTDCMIINRIVGSYEEVNSTTRLLTTSHSNYYDIDVLSPHHLRQQIPYEIFNFETKVIGANEEQLRIDYRARVTDPNLFSTPFVLALAHLLASEIAIPIVGGELGRSLRGESLNLYERYFNNAVQNDQNQKHQPVLDSEYVLTRR